MWSEYIGDRDSGADVSRFLLLTSVVEFCSTK